MENTFLEKTFKLKENNTSVTTEILAGITTFMTMSYILAVNPLILGDAGMDMGGVFTATALASVIAILLMAFGANYPFALSAGMGLNAFFAYSVVLGGGHTWQFALTAVFLEGLIFLVMSLFKIREAIFNAIPMTLKKAVSVGIGLFIALIGFSNSKLIVAGEGTIVTLGNLKSPEVMVTLFGIVITGILLAMKFRGAILAGILGSTVLAIILGVTKLPTSIVSLPPSIAPVAMKLEFTNIFTFEMLVVVFTFLFVDIFDTIGTLIGVATKADMLDESGKLPRVGRALFADAVGTTVGALLGTSTVTTYVESASGVADGGRTGLTALSTGFFFFLSLFFFPIFAIVPASATAPALIIVGLFMMEPIKDIDFKDFTEAIPAFLTITMMPFAYSIAEGIVFGMVSYVLLKVLTGKAKDVSILMYILAVIFILKSILT
ncbi:NCS2 family permease [Microaceticoccus formicicus]|uniref:NCS2 family permease n=1 Tax=Microaceticoccus formicicus TaxID=3118105 RepID=UPI003CD01D19|nr:NCS2 family permease [Peptoniphilaceae bacterium AMB_02]